MTELAADARTYLHGLKRPGVQLGLERMHALTAALGHPQRRVPVVHIAGTNGKGSVAAMLESILRAAGWRTGLYTSPHLVRLGERIQVNATPITQNDLGDAVLRLRGTVETLVREHGDAVRPTYFEFMTALAFTHFAAQRCDIAVVETGLGGRIDATNIVMPELSVITSIGLDHTEFLGPTLADIAGEKAGIIKPARPVAIGSLPREAEDMVRRAAGAAGSLVASVAEQFGDDAASYPDCGLPGQFQRVNAATATLAAGLLAPAWRLDAAAIRRGLRDVRWPARWQRVRVGAREVIIDATHNEEGARVLAANLEGVRPSFETPADGVSKLGLTPSSTGPVVIVGALGAQRATPLLKVVARHASAIHLVVPQQSRACSHEELERLVPPGFGGRLYRSVVSELFRCGEVSVDAPEDVPVVVTGSIYLAGEVLWRLGLQEGPFEPDLQDF